jgi:hypothetical protein
MILLVSELSAMITAAMATSRAAIRSSSASVSFSKLSRSAWFPMRSSMQVCGVSGHHWGDAFQVSTRRI